MKLSFARLFLLGVVALFIGRLSYISEPYGISVDESTYLSISEVLHSGGTLYKDVVDRKPPGLFAAYFGIGSVFGVWNIHALHFVFFLITLAIALGLRRLSLRLTNHQFSANWVFVAYCLFSSCFPREIISANAEYLMLACLIWAFIWVERSTFVAFLLMSVSILCKQYSVLIFLPYLAMRWIQQRGRFRDEFFLFCFAQILFGGLVAAYFYWRGALEEFIYYSFLDGLHYVSGSRRVENHSTSGLVAVSGMFFSWLPLWIGAAVLGFKRRSIFDLSLVAAAIGALVTIFLSGRYYTHYFIPFLAFMTVFGVLGILQIEQKRWQKALVGLSIFIFLGYAFFNLERELVSQGWSFTREKQKRLETVADWIKRNSQSSDRIAVWGMASQIYVMSQRGSGTRFVFADFVSGRQPGLKSDVSLPTPGASEKYIEDLVHKSPQYIIDTSSASINDYQWFPLERAVSIHSEVEKRYELVPNDTGFLIWRLSLRENVKGEL